MVVGEERRIKGGGWLCGGERGTMAVTLEEWKTGGMDERREAYFCSTVLTLLYGAGGAKSPLRSNDACYGVQ